MASSTGSLFGWDLLYASVEKDIKNNLDVLVCYTHLVLISNGFKSIGLGESKNLDGTENQTETLPKGWNDNYAIRYVHQGRLYNLRGTNMDDAVMINLIRVQERTVSMVQLNARAVVQRTGTLSQMMPNNEELARTIQDQLIDKLIVSTKSKESSSQTTSSDDNQGSTSLRIDRPPINPLQESLGQFPIDRRIDPFGIGRSDLDPLGGRFDPFGMPGHGGIVPPGGGGMLFMPPRGGRPGSNPNLGVAPGSVPPGARFDPFRPPDVERGPRRPHNPDNDELPPPGFDDMFM